MGKKIGMPCIYADAPLYVVGIANETYWQRGRIASGHPAP